MIGKDELLDELTKIRNIAQHDKNTLRSKSLPLAMKIIDGLDTAIRLALKNKNLNTFDDNIFIHKTLLNNLSNNLSNKNDDLLISSVIEYIEHILQLNGYRSTVTYNYKDITYGYFPFRHFDRNTEISISLLF